MRNWILPGLALCACGANAQNLIVNGSFEDPLINADQTDGSIYYKYGFAPLAPWTNGNLLVLQNRAPYWVASDGQQFVNLQYSSVFQISQDVATTAGQQYRLSFDLTSDNVMGQWDRNDCTVGVKWNGVTIGTFTPSADARETLVWDSHSLLVTATSASANVAFYDVNNNVNFIGPVLDNIRLEAVPEAGTLAALSAGLVALLARRRRS